jgi:hypothetical protein
MCSIMDADLFQNIVSGLVGFTGTNSLAYSASSSMRKKTSFKILTTFVNVLKKIFFVID